MYFESMEILIFGILILLMSLAAWDLLSDIAEAKDRRPTQAPEGELAEEI
jgi:hypothetical protein